MTNTWIRQVFRMSLTTYDILVSATNDAKYLNRLNRNDFASLLFPDSVDVNYVELKWREFASSPMHFMWGCSYDKLEILAQYIDDCKAGA
tara:strand:- start:306 stop:575 length:270 start_codon:yes stop_codon:yes gene_type:complete